MRIAGNTGVIANAAVSPQVRLTVASPAARGEPTTWRIHQIVALRAKSPKDAVHH